MYVIDTNVLPALRRPDRAPQLAAWLQGTPEAGLFLSAIPTGRIGRGMRLQARRDPELARDLQLWPDRTMRVSGDRSPAFAAEDARIRGRLRAEITHTGADLKIAAMALRHGATLVTRSTDDFTPTGVALEDPFRARA